MAYYGTLDAALDTQGSALSASLGIPHPQAFAVFGDSIAARGDGVVDYQARGWWVWANALLGWRFRFLGNVAISGNTLTQMLARLDTDLVPLKAPWVFQDGGVNDVLGGRSSAAIIADLQTLFNREIAAGMRVVHLALNPVGGTFPLAQQQVRDEVNAWLRAYGASNPNVIVIDASPVLQDPTSYAPLATLLPDALHQNPDGAAAIGKVVADTLRPVTVARNELPMGLDSRNRLGVVGMFNGNQGTGLATGWQPTVGGTAPTYTKVARTDGVRGEWQRVVVPNGANYVGLRPSTDVTVTPGTKYFGIIEVASSAYDPAPAANTKRFQLQLMFRDSGGASPASAYCMQQEATDDQLAPIPSGVLRTPDAIAPPTAATVRLIVWCVGGGTYDLARAAVLPAL